VNIRKRLVKSPKIFWRDTGLLHALLNAPDEATLLNQPWVGASWEGFVIEQVLGEISARGHRVDPYYFRTSDGYEIDLILDYGNERWAIEVKLTASPSPSDMIRLDNAADMVEASHRFLISQTPRSAGDEKRASCNLAGFFERLS
jgi:predicted AAA+ superfamily ATPase